ncbi:hypothetical protein [Oleiagrimonas sp. C23AA]|uniref:hypothetical protein n=1 Tax=Oleiagrimonas sp. C23AA TaxID=2719047 RepID=UPI00141DC045|nr:hypothetical protein [Oleiagrimonas sp. C23AA]NII09466.1 hypothetical protein [Oleiagrimonas sp. C23AA]
MDTEKMTGSRWWEFYFVRYAMGTVVGGLIVANLIKVDHPLREVFCSTLLPSSGMTRVLVLGCYGLVYCYISSVPILVFHVGRSLLPSTRPIMRSKAAFFWQKSLPVIIPMIAYSMVMAVLFIPFFLLRQRDVDLQIGRLAQSTLIVLLCLPVAIVVIAIFLKGRSYYFYKRLAHARSKQSNEEGIVSSYRHLREHGNSLFIVLLEFILGINIYAAHRAFVHSGASHMLFAPELYVYGLILFIWILPGAGVWIFATLIENEFVRDQA